VRTALVSDIHANLAAFEAVLAHIGSKNVDRIICLGDIVGYGPDPVECVDLVAQRCEWSLMGNHDCAVLYEPTNFNEAARAAAFWTRDQLNSYHKRRLGELDGLRAAGEIGPETLQRRSKEVETDRQRRLEFIMTLAVRKAFGAFICVHGTPRKCINEYLFPDDTLSSPQKVAQIFAHVPRYCLVGHTHVPGVFTDEPDFWTPEDLDGVYVLRPEAATACWKRSSTATRLRTESSFTAWSTMCVAPWSGSTRFPSCPTGSAIDSSKVAEKVAGISTEKSLISAASPTSQRTSPRIPNNPLPPLPPSS